jgi:hypothetical protein
VYLSDFGMDDVQIKAAGNTAEVGIPGRRLDSIRKTGLNRNETG